MEPTENDPITRRLHTLGDQPVDPEVASRHRSLIAAVPVASSRSRLRPLMVGSLLAGSLLGGMGLAAAAPGVPDSASHVAQSVLATVTLGVVDHPDDADHDAAEAAKEAAEEAKDAAEEAKDANETNEEPKAAKAAKTESDGDHGDHGVTRAYTDCPLPGDKTGTHGQYVSSVEDNPLTTDVNEREVAAKSDCGKPVHPNESATHDDNPNKPADPKHAADDHRQDGVHPADADNSGNGQSSAEHPDDNADEHAGGVVSGHRPATAGNSAGHGPE